MLTPAARSRPLPPIPVSTGTVASTEDREPSRIAPYPSRYGRWRESTISICSVQTVLPAYSPVHNPITTVALARNETPSPSTHPLDSTGAPDNDPPPYSLILPHASNAEDPTMPSDMAVHEQQGTSSTANPQPRQRRSNFVQHRLFLAKKGAPKPWATLSLVSRPPLPNSLGKTPRFIGGDSVEGALELELDTPTSIYSLTLNVKGRLITRYPEQPSYDKRDFVFLNYKHELYSRDAVGDPYQFGQCAVSRNKAFDGKMEGTYHFPFSFPFPTEVELGDGQNDFLSATQKLPPSFMGGSGATVRYEIELTVGYGKLKMNDRVGTKVVYLPKIVAPPASEGRRAAYIEGALLPGPRNDPAGWTSNASVTLTGCFQDREAQISCSLWLAKPLCYTRGTVLPCYLSISGVDSQLLEHLASPQLIDVRLLQYINYCGDVVHPSCSLYQMTANEEEIEVVRSAVWWRPPKFHEPDDPKIRWLEGEIHLPKDLPPSCDYRLFMIGYAVEMMPFLSGAFISDTEEDRHLPLIRQPVEIATFHEYGPIPTPFTVKHENEVKDRRSRRSVHQRKQSWIDMS